MSVVVDTVSSVEIEVNSDVEDVSAADEVTPSVDVDCISVIDDDISMVGNCVCSVDVEIISVVDDDVSVNGDVTCPVDVAVMSVVVSSDVDEIISVEEDMMGDVVSSVEDEVSTSVDVGASAFK